MGHQAMDLTKKHFDQIGEYVQENLATWSKKISLVGEDFEFQKHFLIITTELRHQRELLIEGFKNSDKRFEQVDKRFEQDQKNSDQRFSQMQKIMDKRFEQTDKRFDRIYSFMKWQTGLGFIMAMGIYIKLFLG